MQVEQIDFIAIPTRDPERAIAFYCDVLGIPESEYRGPELETPNVTLTFWQPEEQDLEFKPNESGFALRVADVHAAVEEARAAGAEIMGIHDSSVCHMGFVKDPDGNVLILHRRYAPRVRREQG